MKSIGDLSIHLKAGPEHTRLRKMDWN